MTTRASATTSAKLATPANSAPTFPPKKVPNASIVWKAQYQTYGNIAINDIEDVENNLRFQRQYFDSETGLHDNRHRYYNPNTGSFTTQDPIGLAGGINNYQYAPNPIAWIDPLGLTCKENLITNSLPENGEFSRVMPRKYAQAFAKGKRPIAGGNEVWIGAADDLSCLTTVIDTQKKLSIFNDYDEKKPNLSGDTIVKFKLKDTYTVDLRSPIETMPTRGYGFQHGSRTAGGNKEWLINNGTAHNIGAYDIKLTFLKK